MAKNESNVAIKETKKIEYNTWKKKAKKAVAMAKIKSQGRLFNLLANPDGQRLLYRITKVRERKVRDVIHIKYKKDETNTKKLYI